MKVKYHKQEKNYTCGAAAMRMALNSIGFNFSEKEIENMLKTDEIRGTWTKAFSQATNQLKVSYCSKDNSSIESIKELIKSNIVIVCFYTEDNDDHYTLVRKIDDKFIYFADPWYGPNFKMPLAEFEERWRCDPKFEKVKRWFFALEKRPSEKPQP